MPEESSESYQIIPVTPLKRLEKRMDKLENAGTMPQLQSLINQIIELIRSNQKIVNDVIQANAELRNEIAKLPSKLDEVTTSLKTFISLIEAAGREEVSSPGPEVMKPVTEQLTKMVEQNQKLLESNQAMLDKLDTLGKRKRRGTPVSELLTSYPGIRLRKEVR
jgi:hypothetical protein